MLHGLDEIDWVSLNDCYGPATKVEGLIRGLANRNAKQQYETLDELGNQICHQASCSEATPYAIPFLIELSQIPRIKNRDVILNLLLHIAVGLDSDLLHDHVNITEYMAEVERQSESYRPAKVGLECYRLVENATPTFIDLLNDTNRKTRICAAYNLSWFPSKHKKSLPRLREHLRIANNSQEIANLIVSVGHLEYQANVSRPIIPYIRGFLGHRNQLIRLATAIYLDLLAPSDESTNVIVEFSENMSYDGRIPFFNYCLHGYAERIVTMRRITNN